MPRCIRGSVLIPVVCALAGLLSVRESHAGCTPAPTAGDDTITCNAATPPDPTVGTVDLLGGNDRITVHSGTYSSGINGNLGNDTIILLDGTVASVTDLSGNNTLILGPGGTPTIGGNVTFGAGRDRLEVHSGGISGTVNQAAGIDTFIMSGGQIQSLDQGSERDIAIISGGRIVGTFTDGDVVTMTGGRIGLVNLIVGNNILTMSGGTIDTNVVAEQDNDTLNLSGGTIGGFVDFGNGNNIFNVTGGQIGAGIVSGTGTDQLTWSGGGTVGGPITLGAGTDTATLRNLTPALMSATTLLDGGAGTDTLTFDATEATGVARFQNWEAVNLSNGTRLTLDTNFVLGDAGTGIGALSIDATSTLFAGGGVNASIVPFTGGQLVSVTNSGTIDLTNGATTANDRFTIVGNYLGTGGHLILHTILGTDGSPSDRLRISDGTASGDTGIVITNLGGAGALTTADGILVVEAVGGGTTAPDAFRLASPAAAGAFEYLLFRGGVTPGNDDNWYLRSTMVASSGPPEPIPLYRPEVAVYSVLPAMARTVTRMTLGTYHERIGGDNDVRPEGAAGSTPGAWGRVFGGRGEESWSGTVSPSFDGYTVGLQAGQEVLRRQTAQGHRDNAGIYVGHAQSEGDVRGFAIGRTDADAGKARLTGTSVGGYWSHVGPAGWYADGVLQATAFGGHASSDRGVGLSPGGFAATASLEGGYPIRLAPGLTLEPQAQGIWQRLSLDDGQDEFSTIAFATDDTVTGRVGLRLYGTFSASDTLWRPYLKANLWHTMSGADHTIFAATDVIDTKRNTTTLEIGVGGTVRQSQALSVYGDVSYLTGVDGADQHGIVGRMGVKLDW